jgi:hypothetical protein
MRERPSSTSFRLVVRSAARSAATVGQRVHFQCDRRAEPHRKIRVVRHRVLGQRVDEDIEPSAVHHQVGDHLRELVGLENDQHVGARVRPDRRVAKASISTWNCSPSAAHTPSATARVRVGS